MTIREWKNLNGNDFAQLDPKKCIVLVTVSPLEVHGPHLPTMTDNAEGEAILLHAVKRISAKFPDLTFLHLPPVFVAADVLPHRGSVMFRSSTIVRVLEDIGRSLGKQGFRRIVVSNFHGGPRHFVPIEVACERSNRKYNTEMISIFSLLLNELTGGRTDLPGILGHIPGMSLPDLVGDAHAGLVETSLMLHLHQEWVDDSYTNLPRKTVELKYHGRDQEKLASGAKPSLIALLTSFIHKIKYYEEETYSGSPGKATAELGRDILDVLSGYAANVLEKYLQGDIDLKKAHSPLWPVRWIFTLPTLSFLFERAVNFKQRVF